MENWSMENCEECGAKLETVQTIENPIDANGFAVTVGVCSACDAVLVDIKEMCLISMRRIKKKGSV